MCLNKHFKNSNLSFTDDEKELLDILIFSGVQKYVDELYKICKQNDKIEVFLEGLKEVEEILVKLDFEFEINLKIVED